MDNKSKTLPPYGSMMPPFTHHPAALHGPPPGPPGPPPPGPARIPSRDSQPHSLPAPIPHSSTYDPSWRQQPYPPPHYETTVERRHSTPVTNPAPHSQPPPPPHIPYPSAPHPAQQQSRELPQLPPGDPYHRPNSLPAPTPTHPPPEDLSPRGHYRPMNGTQTEPTPHSAAPPPPNDFRQPRIPYTGPPESPVLGSTNGEHAGPPPGYMSNVPPPYHGQPPPGIAYDASGNYNYTRQRKAARAQQACDQCRARKAKCDEGRPSCSHCKENNVPCNYKEVPPHKQEKTTQMILDRIDQKEEVMKDLLEKIVKKIAATDDRVDRLFEYFSEQGHAVPEQRSSTATTNASDSRKSMISTSTFETETKVDSTLKHEPSSLEQYNEKLKTDEANPIEIKDEDGEGELSIPIEHTTAAHKLLSWPSISRLLDHRVNEDYVLTCERKRGLIRIYGCGEGHDHDSEYYYQKDQRDRVAPVSVDSPATTSSSSPHFDEGYPQASSPNWGYGLPVTPGGRSGENPVGLDQSGYLSTQPDLVRRYYLSYMENIHNLHPFLDKKSLERKVERFIRQYGYPRKNMNSSVSSNVGEARGTKRKRSIEAMTISSQEMSRSPSFNSEKWMPHRIERSIDNAIILLVLALGAICENKGPIPAFAPEPTGRSRAEAFPVSPEAQAVFNDILSPASGSASGGATARSFHSPSVPSPDLALDWKTPTPRPISKIGQDGSSEDFYPKNVHVIPGLAYYAYAAGILGDLQGGNELPYVQAAILASFYAGQLAHPFQSHGWIFQAARACQFIIREKEYNSMPESPLKELYQFAFWTCLQHESDILAELDLANSGISRSEARISLPSGRKTLELPNTMEAPETKMMFFYSAQIHLRKVLNRIHTDLYKVTKKKGSSKLEKETEEYYIEDTPDFETSRPKIPHAVLQVLGISLDEWKANLPVWMQWDERDPPSSDINTARLRAKYYGARYIIYRPLLHYALHQLPTNTKSSASTEPRGRAGQSESTHSASSFVSQGPRAPGMARWSSETGTSPNMEDEANIYPTVKLESLNPQIQQACTHCIRAAVQSTIAFDGIQGRPILTNIFGTAHAQFGNMLVLSATYMSGLRQLIERDELEMLLKRTIRFLAQSKDISPTLRADAQILSGIYYKIFKQSPNTSFATESFSTNT